MSYKPLDDRQVVNRLALSNIGSPANDTLDDIFNRINAILGGLTSNSSYIANSVALTAGTTSYTVTIPARPDLSYVVLAMMQNTVDSTPQYQQVEVVSKSTTGFIFEWNAPLSSSNYLINFIIPALPTQGGETSIPSASTSVTAALNIPQNGPSYGIIGVTQNLVDTYPQFQTALITAQTSTSFTDSFNAPTSSANYQLVWIDNPTAQVAVGSGVTSVVVPLPIAYGSTGFTVVASLSDVTDTYPQFQPLLVTAQTSSQFTVSFNAPTSSANYILTYFAISTTAV
jgi:hypothetical protein